MKDTKRVDELEVGDIVIFPHLKEPRTISSIKPPSSLNNKLYVIHTEETQNTIAYIGSEKVIYLDNNKEKEEIMKTQKIDCTVLYPYLDNLIDSESNCHVLDLPTYLNKELKNIYELFEDVLGLTLGEVKILYFERKMSKQDAAKTKKAKDLCIGDKVLFPGVGEIVVTKLASTNQEFVRKVEWAGGFEIIRTEAELTLLDV